MKGAERGRGGGYSIRFMKREKEMGEAHPRFSPTTPAQFDLSRIGLVTALNERLNTQ
jgi:hypothetical protein